VPASEPFTPLAARFATPHAPATRDVSILHAMMTNAHNWLSVAVGLVVALGGHATITQDDRSRGHVANEHRAYLQKFRSDRADSLLKGTPATLSGYYAESVRLMPAYQKTVLGKANAVTYLNAFVERFRVPEYRIEEKEVLDLGSQLVSAGVFTMKLARKSDGHLYELSGKYMDIWQKSPQGTLALITEAWNYSHQVAFADDLKFEHVPAVIMAFQPHLLVKDDISVELAALNKLLEASISQHDAGPWSLYYADDAMLLANFEPIHEGRRAVTSYLERHAAQFPVFEKLDIRHDRIDNLGAYVIEYATHVANWRNGDSSGVNTGKDLRIWRRTPGGPLKLYRQIGMYD
jgi:ketosteroid isomerase-like protein